MKRILTAATVAALAISTLAGCTINIPRSDPAPTTTHSSQAQSGDGSSTSSSDKDEAFLSAVHEEATINAGDTDADLIKLGHAVCTALDNGATPDQIGDKMIQSANGDTQTAREYGAVYGAGVAAYCPQYLSEVQTYFKSLEDGSGS